MQLFKFQMKTFFGFLLLASALFITSCKEDPVRKTEFFGKAVTVGAGKAMSYVKTDDDGEPLEIGVMFDEKALENLPTGHAHGYEYVLELPTDVDVAPFNHIAMHWNEHGHEPEGVYTVPHFDYHFYFMTNEARKAIGANDSTQFNKPLPAQNLPPQYFETPGGVPAMGAHIVDLLSPEIAGTGPFTKTFIFGKYDANLIFIEPMITVEYLKGKPNESIPIRQPQKWQKTGYYPTSYGIRYNEATKMYRVVMENLQHKHP
jgi:hypothetical protein